MNEENNLKKKGDRMMTQRAVEDIKKIRQCKKHTFKFHQIIKPHGLEGKWEEWKCIHCPMRDIRKEVRTMKPNPFDYTFKDLYELTLKEGERRFGSFCKHEKVKNGYCVHCLRKIIIKKDRTNQ